jgi:hypothetical protein
VEPATHSVRCELHPASLAGWQCDSCRRALCSNCVAVGLQGLVVCTTCGHGVREVRVPRAVVFPFRDTWASALRPIASWKGVLQVLFAALAVQTLLSFSSRWWILGRVLELGWLLFLARRAGVGFDPFGVPRYSDLASVWTGPMLRLLAGAGPVLLVAAWLSSFGQQAVSLASPWPWLLAALAVVVVPPSVVVASVEGPGQQVPWPWQLPSWLRRLGGDLVPLQLAVAVIAGLEAIDGSLAPFSTEDTKLDWHIAQAFLPRLGAFFAVAALGSLTGLLVRTRATELGHGAPGEDLVPLVNELPAGRWTPPAPDPESVAAEQARRFAPIELEDPAHAVASAIARKDVDEALAELASGSVAPDALDSALVVELAQLLAGRGDAVTAAKLLRGVTMRPPDAQTPRGLVILARLCVERLHAVDEGRALYRRVVSEFPGTPAARFAEAQLPSAHGTG